MTALPPPGSAPAAATPRRHAAGVYIGRFEPPHTAHLRVMLEALERAERLIVVIGSAQAPRTPKNPFSADERQALITAMLAEAGAPLDRLRFVQVRDFLYDEARWLAAVRAGVRAHTGGDPDVALIGHLKDESSYYLRSFPDWAFLPTRVVSPLSATDVRRAYFAGHLERVSEMVPPAVHTFLTAFGDSPAYAELRAEDEYLHAYRAAWASAPHAPVFVTADAVVTRGGHLLVVRRAGWPGRGQLALPGGFLQPGETLLACAVRRVALETGLPGAAGLAGHLRAQAVFDAPGRSQRGRTVTHAFHFDLNGDLGGGPLPRVQPGDGVAAACWLPLAQALDQPQAFFEDHHAIIEHFVPGTLPGTFSPAPADLA